MTEEPEDSSYSEFRTPARTETENNAALPKEGGHQSIKCSKAEVLPGEDEDGFYTDPDEEYTDDQESGQYNCMIGGDLETIDENSKSDL